MPLLTQQVNKYELCALGDGTFRCQLFLEAEIVVSRHVIYVFMTIRIYIPSEHSIRHQVALVPLG